MSRLFSRSRRKLLPYLAHILYSTNQIDSFTLSSHHRPLFFPFVDPSLMIFRNNSYVAQVHNIYIVKFSAKITDGLHGAHKDSPS